MRPADCDAAVPGARELPPLAPKDGGPAFPTMMASGASLRDVFAWQALSGMCANPGGPIQANGMSGWGLCNCTPEDVAGMAYELADAMLAAREQQA